MNLWGRVISSTKLKYFALLFERNSVAWGIKRLMQTLISWSSYFSFHCEVTKLKELQLLLPIHRDVFITSYQLIRVQHHQGARSGRLTCSVWGWTHLPGVEELANIEERFTADRVTELLKEVMLPSVHACACPNPDMQVNYVVHKLKKGINMNE